MMEPCSRIISKLKVIDGLAHDLLTAISDRNLDHLEAMMTRRQEKIIELVAELASDLNNAMNHYQYLDQIRKQDAEIMHALKSENEKVKNALSQFHKVRKYSLS
ncbi:hypothetical protein AQUSIP_24200 [Aquicella siphonis]|uniref:Flagellar protein FliT n=1 Tax=Aquicella siphonis TaxID=254247 RepID=A0A5E4PLA2_9COXI|nr:hypothetical protein [Aquicella siphonis]VVC77093.1 hypothetical protein AQUSIP_24200 [Aquicella siphonis]